MADPRVQVPCVTKPIGRGRRSGDAYPARADVVWYAGAWRTPEGVERKRELQRIARRQWTKARQAP